MGGYLESGGLKTWWDEQGVGEPLVLLHGGLTTNANWAAQMSDFVGAVPGDRAGAPGAWSHTRRRGTSVV